MLVTMNPGEAWSHPEILGIPSMDEIRGQSRSSGNARRPEGKNDTESWPGDLEGVAICGHLMQGQRALLTEFNTSPQENGIAASYYDDSHDDIG